MADTITKILIRKGLDIQRRTANSNGIIFSSGEPGWCYDTKRLFIGDGAKSGGYPVGSQFIGSVATFYGSGQNGFSNTALNVFSTNGAAYGDIIYDRETRSVYVLTAADVTSSKFPPLTSDFIKLDTSPLLNSTQLEYNLQRQIQIKNGGVGPQQLSFGVVDGATLTKLSFSDPISIADSGVTNAKLAQAVENTVKGNPTPYTSNPQDIKVYPMHIVGRTAISSLTAIPFNTILQELAFNPSNGIVIDKTGATVNVRNDTSKIIYGSNRIQFQLTTTVNAPLSVTGDIRASGDIIAFSTLSDKKAKNDIKKISDPFKRIDSLNGYEFKFNEVAPTHLRDKYAYGLLAQEVEDTLPYAVENRPAGLKGINYNQVLPLLVECIKELKSEITEIKCNLKKQ